MLSHICLDIRRKDTDTVHVHDMDTEMDTTISLKVGHVDMTLEYIIIIWGVHIHVYIDMLVHPKSNHLII